MVVFVYIHVCMYVSVCVAVCMCGCMEGLSVWHLGYEWGNNSALCVDRVVNASWTCVAVYVRVCMCIYIKVNAKNIYNLWCMSMYMSMGVRGSVYVLYSMLRGVTIMVIHCVYVIC